MTAILIEPVALQSIGSFAIEITGIDPTDKDCLIGTIITTGKGQTREAWNLNGIMRGGSSPLNIDMSLGNLDDVISLAKHLGA